jgi:two-component system NtrC family sensor kinase
MSSASNSFVGVTPAWCCGRRLAPAPLLQPPFTVLMLPVRRRCQISPLEQPPPVARLVPRLPARALVATAAAVPMLFLVVALAIPALRVSAWAAAFLMLAALSACCLAANLVARRIARAFAEVERQRDAVYEEIGRLSKAAALGEIASGIAHDLNNPLAIINEEAGWILDLLDHPEPDTARIAGELKASLAQIQSQTRRAADFTRRVLAWARDIDHPAGAVDVNRMLEAALALLQYDLTASGVRVVTRFEPELPAVAGNEAELRQVFLHLMKNAVDAMDGEETRTLMVSTTLEQETVRTEIADTGRGISREVMAHIFEPFFTTKPEGRGTGLGLPIAAWIVKRAGGRIEVDSAPGNGARFLVVLPPAPLSDGAKVAGGAQCV